MGFFTTQGATAAEIAAAYPAAAPIADEIVAVSERLGIKDPGWLANLMNFESRFRPDIQNKYTNATGLIQFMPSTARGLGTTVDALKGMSQEEQMPWVEKYLAKKKKKGFNSQMDVFMAVFFPAAMGKGPDFDIYGWYQENRSQGAADTYLRQNAGIKTAGDYTSYVFKNAKLPIGTDIGGGLRAYPFVLGGSILLLSLALYIRIKEPSWAAPLTRRIGG